MKLTQHMNGHVNFLKVCSDILMKYKLFTYFEHVKYLVLYLCADWSWA